MNGIIFSSSPGCGGKETIFRRDSGFALVMRRCGTSAFTIWRALCRRISNCSYSNACGVEAWWDCRRESFPRRYVWSPVNLRHTLHSSSAHNVDGAASSNELEQGFKQQRSSRLMKWAEPFYILCTWCDESPIELQLRVSPTDAHWILHSIYTIAHSTSLHSP